MNLNSSQRIILNTLATYGLSVFAAGLAIFSSRWILNALGQTDYGLFNLVGSLIVFVTFLNGLLGSSAGRFFAFSMGKGDVEGINQWFNTAFIIHTVLPTILIIIGWPIGEYCIQHIFTIPPDRIRSCAWIFRLSLISSFVGMGAIPYLAMFNAKQKITETAYWGLLQCVLTFILAYILTTSRGDRLLFYAVGMASVSVLLSLIQVARAIFLFPECRINRKHWFNRGQTIEIFNFTAWMLIGGLGNLFRSQGTAVLLNLFHGPKVNAAYSLANQVSTQTGTFAQSMINAMLPEITTTAGRGDHNRLLALTVRASKLGTILVFFFIIPLVIEMEYILKIWLKIPPNYTAIFCQLILFSFLVDRLTAGSMMAITAQGRIAAYQGTVGLALLMTLPFGYLLLKLFHVPSAALVALLITSIASGLLRIYWGKRLLNLSPRQWVSEVLVRCSIVAVPSALLGSMPKLFLAASFFRLGLSVILSCGAIVAISWLVALTKDERTYFINLFGLIVNKITKYGVNK